MIDPNELNEFVWAPKEPTKFALERALAEAQRFASSKTRDFDGRIIKFITPEEYEMDLIRCAYRAILGLPTKDD